MPWDRHWAVIHKDTKFDTTHPEWAMCRNFMIGTSTPDLAGIWAKLDTARGSITLSHQALGQITFAPDDKAVALSRGCKTCARLTGGNRKILSQSQIAV